MRYSDLVYSTFEVHEMFKSGSVKYFLVHMKVDLISLHMFTSMLSVVLQMTATILMIFCVVNLFSLKPASSLKGVAIGIFYFFTSVVLLFIGASALMDLSRPFHFFVGTSALLEACLVHLCYGSLVVALYLKEFQLSKIKLSFLERSSNSPSRHKNLYEEMS